MSQHVSTSDLISTFRDWIDGIDKRSVPRPTGHPASHPASHPALPPGGPPPRICNKDAKRMTPCKSTHDFNPDQATALILLTMVGLCQTKVHFKYLSNSFNPLVQWCFQLFNGRCWHTYTAHLFALHAAIFFPSTNAIPLLPSAPGFHTALLRGERERTERQQRRSDYTWFTWLHQFVKIEKRKSEERN